MRKKIHELQNSRVTKIEKVRYKNFETIFKILNNRYKIEEL